MIDDKRISCPKCGAENQSMAAFCKKCGSPLNNDNKTENGNTSGKTCSFNVSDVINRIIDWAKENKKIVGAGIVALIAIVFISKAASIKPENKTSDEDAVNTPEYNVNETDGADPDTDQKSYDNIETFDPFEGLEVSFSGTAPFIQAEVKYNGSELSIDDFSWQVPDRLSNGGELCVTLNGDEDKYIDSIGKKPERYENYYAVEGFSGILSPDNGLSGKAFVNLRNDAYNRMINQLKDYNPDGIRYCGDIVFSPSGLDEYLSDLEQIKEAEQAENSYYVMNEICFVFKGVMHPGGNNIPFYYLVKNYNVFLTPDGDVESIERTEAREYQEQSWDQIYDFDFSFLTDTEYYATSINIDPEGMDFTPDSSSAGSNENGDAAETSSGFIFPKSDRDLLEIEDLEKLSKDECSLARNEIYARHGRKFKDESIQAYFDSCSWYKGETEPDDFDESTLNVFEKANRDLISKYEKEKGYR